MSGVDTKHNRLEKNNDSYIMATEWKQVEPNEEMPFFFQRREKIRHKVGNFYSFFVMRLVYFKMINISSIKLVALVLGSTCRTDSYLHFYEVLDYKQIKATLVESLVYYSNLIFP